MTSTLSPFAVALKDLLDATEFYTRLQWAQFFDIEESTIHEWITDTALPSSGTLRMMLDILHSRARVREPLDRFNKLTKRPSTEISPLGEFMAPTVEDYLSSMTLSAFGKRLRRLSPEQQIRVLRTDSWNADAIATYMGKH